MRPEALMDRLGIPRDKRPPSRASLLFVDDHRATCRSVRDAFRRRARVLTAHDGRGVERWLAEGLKPAAGLVDEALGRDDDARARCSGLAVIAQLRRADVLVPVVLCLDPRRRRDRHALSNALLAGDGPLPKLVRRPRDWRELLPLVTHVARVESEVGLRSVSTAEPNEAPAVFDAAVAAELAAYDPTPAARAVLQLRAAGCSWDAIAARRGTSRRTVRRQAKLADREDADDVLLQALATAARSTAPPPRPGGATSPCSNAAVARTRFPPAAHIGRFAPGSPRPPDLAYRAGDSPGPSPKKGWSSGSHSQNGPRSRQPGTSSAGQ